MSGFATGPFLSGLAVTAAADVVLFAGTWLVGRRLGRWNVVDVTWGLAFALIAAVSFLWARPVHGGNELRQVLVALLTLAWSLRLAGYIGWRSRGKGEDPRYAAMFEKAGPRPGAYALKLVFGPQAFLSWLVSIPVQMAMYERAATGPLTWAGTALWAVGLFFEAVGDAQMHAFRSHPANRGRIMDGGLWRYTRHPNYFGDACVWFGLYLICAQSTPGWTAIVSPAAMLYFLYFKSGKGLLEKSMAGSRPGYADYMKRTSGFIPRPPRGR